MFKKARSAMAKNAGQKRQAPQTSIEPEENTRRTRSKVSSDATETVTDNKRATRSSDQSGSFSNSIFKGNGYGTPSDEKSTKDKESTEAASTPRKKVVKKGIAQKVVTPKKRATSQVTKNGSKPSTKAKPTTRPPTKPASKGARRYSSSSLSAVSIPVRTENEPVARKEDPEDDDPAGPSYWLMKAEPESRIEKGKDIRFSIDDLKNAPEPEAWDGVRNAVARNNMRAMMTGDMAFFWHSNCKKPGIVGTMEIVREHSVDETAFDPEHPYYDEKSTREKPKWCVVHVEFRRKFPEMVTLKELKKYSEPGGVLENMQTLKLSRLSVSQVTKKEWDFIHSLVDPDDDTAATN